MKKKLVALGIASTIWLNMFSGNNAYANTADQPAIVDISKKYIGTPYVWGGTTPRGFDCSGFIQYVFNEAGIKLPRTAADMYSSSALKKVSGAKEVGDLVFFTTYKPGASHVGIYLRDGDFIHASTSKGVMISNLNSGYYKSHYIGTRRSEGIVKGVSFTDYKALTQKLWNTVQSDNSTSESLSPVNSAVMKEYQSLKSKASEVNKNAEAAEYLKRTANMIDALSAGNKLEQQNASFKQSLIVDQEINDDTSALYDTFSYTIKNSEKATGKVYGSDNRSNLNERYTTPAKISKETVIFEVSQYRLMEKIEAQISQQQFEDAKANFAMLERLEKRAISIKAEGNKLHPGKYAALETMTEALKAKKQAIQEALASK